MPANIAPNSILVELLKRVYIVYFDLLEHLTDEDILEEVLTNNHCYKPEPLLSKTGVGYLRPATPEERAQEEARSTALIERLKQRAAASGKKAKSTGLMVPHAGKSAPAQ